ncbi:MAG: DASS family sodium-coupled anion symporter [Candidatus Krumholzibacteriota bacterium]|nr:DASS family sodium-coupled anion symporter [Candidatus Krumholzibacteriota bacterium]
MAMEILTGKNIRTLIILSVSLAAGFAISRFAPEGLSGAGRVTLGIFTVAALLWTLEPFPLHVTSFIIVALEVVFLGRAGGPLGFSGNQYGIFLEPFFNPVVVLFLGGFTMANAVKRYGLDERISRMILRRVGSRPNTVLLGMMATTAFLSMWMSNTATTALMLAVALPLMRPFAPGEPFRKAIILGIPFAANIGGMGTPIGTPPNAIAMGILDSMGISISFTGWMIRGLPLVIALLFVSWFVLCRIFPAETDSIDVNIPDEEESLGVKSQFILYAFAAVIILWLTSSYHGIPSSIVALLPIILFFGLRILDDEDFKDLGWNILIIIGGGMSLGIAMKESGLSTWIVGLIPFEGIGLLSVLFIFAFSAAALTTFISNSATANLLIPIAVGIGTVQPMTSAVVIALAASAAMILPVSTPPNAIAYGSGQIDVKDMAKSGAIITIISIVAVTLFIFLLF